MFSIRIMCIENSLTIELYKTILRITRVRKTFNSLFQD